ncbi:PH domain-containing protein [Bacillus sp. m3-13]|uniref:PH domain-containing protein n=1 Tax=Bacillus sp. m3-13 TaxID=406124 RepID=UPI0001E89D7F|nr:PH domain-containing protein [Bacillus sp. m3-13]
MRENSFEISGVYGDEWRFEDITQVDLVEEMPEVYLRTNGYGMQSISKGHFKVKDYGSSLLFIYKGNSPYLLIKTNDDTIFINSKDAEKTKDWYYQLVEQSSEAE